MNWKQFKERFFTDPTRVLALSGGGARGMAHIGVLTHLDQLSLQPELVTGTSMGALVGGLYCLHGSSDGLEAKVHDLFEGELATFADLRIPFVAVATDLYSGEDVALTEGKLATAVQASAAIPGVFPPVAQDGMLLVDGYITKNVPVPEPGEPPNRADVMVVDVQRGLQSNGPWDSGIEILARADWIMQAQLNRFYLELADLVLVPDVRDVHWADFRRIDQLIEAGRVCAVEKEEEIVGRFG